eukprot:8046148-Pyramimonas_sp.AAC.1
MGGRADVAAHRDRTLACWVQGPAATRKSGARVASSGSTLQGVVLSGGATRNARRSQSSRWVSGGGPKERWLQ